MEEFVERGEGGGGLSKDLYTEPLPTSLKRVNKCLKWPRNNPNLFAEKVPGAERGSIKYHATFFFGILSKVFFDYDDDDCDVHIVESACVRCSAFWPIT